MSGPHQQSWDDTVMKLMNMSSGIMKRNGELENQLKELSFERQAMRNEFSLIMDIMEREKSAHKAQIAALNAQLATTDTYKTQTPVVLCIVDQMFAPELYKLGFTGGRQAANQIMEGVAAQLRGQKFESFGDKISLRITLFYDRITAINALSGPFSVTTEQIDEFIFGFSSHKSYINAVDVGRDRELAVGKIEDYLLTYVAQPQTLRALFVPAYDGSIKRLLTSLKDKELLSKTIIAHGYGSPDYHHLLEDIKEFAVKEHFIGGLFFSYQQFQISPFKKHTKDNSFGCYSAHGGLPSPRSLSSGSSPKMLGSRGSIDNTHSVGPLTGQRRLIDPELPLHKQNPPPCNEFYLMSCFKGTNCRYSHDYDLTEEERRVLATNAKKAPCNFLKNGMQCPYGELCCWGHTCPNGSKCFHLSKGKCWFKGDSMHQPSSPTMSSPLSSIRSHTSNMSNPYPDSMLLS